MTLKQTKKNQDKTSQLIEQKKPSSKNGWQFFRLRNFIKKTWANIASKILLLQDGFKGCNPLASILGLFHRTDEGNSSFPNRVEILMMGKLDLNSVGPILEFPNIGRDSVFEFRFYADIL